MTEQPDKWSAPLLTRRRLLIGAAAGSAAAAVAAIAAAITPIQNADTTATAGAQANDALSTPRMGTAQAQTTQTAVGGVTSTPYPATSTTLPPTATATPSVPVPSATPFAPSPTSSPTPTSTAIPATAPPTRTPPTPTATPSGPQVSVRDYGATGNGTTDETAAIQAAINACPTNGTVLFPAGTYIVSVTPSAWINVKSNLTLLGVANTTATIKIRNGNGPFKNIFAPAGAGFIQHFTVKNLGFDTNLAGNSAALIQDADESSYQTCVHIQDGNDLHVTNCLFQAHGLWEVAFNGQSITNCSINGCTVYYTHNLGVPDYDNSCFYIDGTNYQMNNNTFFAMQGPGFARACVETHGGPAEFAGNTGTGFQTLLNLVGLYNAPAGDVNNIDAHDNTANGALQAFRIQPIQNGMDTVKIRNNAIHLTPRAFYDARGGGDDFFGIATLNNAETPAIIKRLTITNNRIDFPEVNGGDGSSPSDNCSGIGVVNTAGADTVTITGNTITRAHAAAIKVGNPANTSNGFSHVTINSNTIIDAGSNLAFPAIVRDGIYVTSKADSLYVHGNTITDDYPLRRTVHPIAIDRASNSGAVYTTQDVAYNTFQGRPIDVDAV